MAYRAVPGLLESSHSRCTCTDHRSARVTHTYTRTHTHVHKYTPSHTHTHTHTHTFKNVYHWSYTAQEPDGESHWDRQYRSKIWLRVSYIMTYKKSEASAGGTGNTWTHFREHEIKGSDYTVVTMLLHCCNTVVTLLLHCCHTSVITRKRLVKESAPVDVVWRPSCTHRHLTAWNLSMQCGCGLIHLWLDVSA
jgi:hypothetical protein